MESFPSTKSKQQAHQSSISSPCTPVASPLRRWTTATPFRTLACPASPSPLSDIHLPSLGSGATAATSTICSSSLNICPLPAAFVSPSPSTAAPSSAEEEGKSVRDVPDQAAKSTEEGRMRSWSELTMPGRGTVRRGEKDLRLEAMDQMRTLPSQEPVNGRKSVRKNNLKEGRVTHQTRRRRRRADRREP